MDSSEDKIAVSADSQESGKIDKVVESLVEEGSRTHKMTEKGQSWHLQILQGKFRTGATAWKKQANSCLVLLSDSDDCQSIRLCRSELESCFSSLVSIVQEFNSYSDDEISSEIDKFVTIENEHMRLMSEISSALRSSTEGGSLSSRKHSTS